MELVTQAQRAEIARQERIHAALESWKVRFKEQYDAGKVEKTNPNKDHFTLSYTDQHGSLWLGTTEGITKRVIARATGGVHFEAGALKAVLFTLEFKGDGEDSSYEQEFTFVKVDHLRQEVVIESLISSVVAQNDSDANRFLNCVLDAVGMVVSYPQSEDEVITKYRYLLLLRQAASAGALMYDQERRELTKINRANIETSMFGELLSVQHTGTLMYGSGIVRGTRRARSPAGSVTIKTARFIPATEDQLMRFKEVNRARATEMSQNGGVQHVMYHGLAHVPEFWGSRVRMNVTGRVVIDAEGCQSAQASAFMSLVRMDDLDISTNDRDEVEAIPMHAVTDEDVAVLSRSVVLYDLQRSRWMLGSADMVSQIEYRSDAFDRLVLAENRKRLVRALTANHVAGSDVDIIEGKGGGAIFLLDGAPGTGKTLTAEATAEHLQRILYKVSLGELGTDVEQLEETLNAILAQASRWNAILLIDEADVFLEKRSSENIQRNALVAVFLRLLEYYTGILFLTTNRGDNFDPAFRSRITLALHFTRPDANGMRKIWSSLLKNANIQVTDHELDLLTKFDVNGREIKNAINSSRALAAEDGASSVTLDHLIEILTVQEGFDEDIKASAGKRGF